MSDPANPEFSFGKTVDWLTRPGTGLATLAGLGALAGGGSMGLVSALEKKRPGETPRERTLRIIRNAAIGAAAGGAGLAGTAYGTRLAATPEHITKQSERFRDWFGESTFKKNPVLTAAGLGAGGAIFGAGRPGTVGSVNNVVGKGFAGMNPVTARATKYGLLAGGLSAGLSIGGPSAVESISRWSPGMANAAETAHDLGMATLGTNDNLMLGGLSATGGGLGALLGHGADKRVVEDLKNFSTAAGRDRFNMLPPAQQLKIREMLRKTFNKPSGAAAAPGFSTNTFNKGNVGYRGKVTGGIVGSLAPLLLNLALRQNPEQN